MTTFIKSSYSFKDKEDNITDNAITELNEIITFERKNIYTCLMTANMKGCILDLGCGPGTTSNIIADFPQISHVIGLDIEARFLKYAQCNTFRSDIEYVQGDCYNIPLEDNSVDCCYSRYLFQHMQYPNKVLDEIVRVTKPGGIIGIHDVDGEMITEAPNVPYADKIKKLNARLKSFSGGDVFIGRKLKDIMEADIHLQNVGQIITYTSSRTLPKFKKLFFNEKYNDKDFITKIAF